MSQSPTADTSCGRLRHDLLQCPPQGRTGQLLASLAALLLLYASLWAVFPDQSLPGSCELENATTCTTSTTTTPVDDCNSTASKIGSSIDAVDNGGDGRGPPPPPPPTMPQYRCTGGLFGLFVLFTLATLAGHICGLIPRCPQLLGMLLAGCFLRSVPPLADYARAIDSGLSSSLRSVALCIILLRAGLGLDPQRLRAMSFNVVLLAFVPCLTEAATVGVASHLLLGLPWSWSFLLGFVLAAISPAVVVPTVIAVSSEGYGVAKGIPTLVIAAASLDDMLAITGFGVLLGVVFGSNESLALTVAKGPLEALLGVAIGAALGLLMWFLPHPTHPRFIFYRFSFLVASGLAPLLGSMALNAPSTGALACLTGAFVAAIGWRSRDGWVGIENPLLRPLETTWWILQPLLFGLIGAEIDVRSLQAGQIGRSLATIGCGLALRMAAAALAVTGAGFSIRERLFISVAWLPKATVQAAIGPLALDTAARTGAGGPNALAWARQILTTSVLIIVVTAPLGALLISLLAPRLLSRQAADGESSVGNDAGTGVHQGDAADEEGERRGLV